VSRPVDRLWPALLGVACFVGLLPGVVALWGIAGHGLAAFGKVDWVTLLPAIVGTLFLTLGACLMAVPLGIAAGLYLAEYPHTRLARLSRFVGDVLGGTPSIVFGVFVWGWLVTATGRFSGWAGSVALALVLLPLVMRVTEAGILAVPASLREAPLVLGWPRWRATLSVTLRAGLPGLSIALLVAIARVAGQAAPLLFTALGNPYLSADLREPMAALPVTVFEDGTAPGLAAQDRAWAAAFLLVLIAALLGIAARAVARREEARDG
jgi:phosphate transport system permease protein